jgi:hypothetical protein
MALQFFASHDTECPTGVIFPRLSNLREDPDLPAVQLNFDFPTLSFTISQSIA